MPTVPWRYPQPHDVAPFHRVRQAGAPELDHATAPDLAGERRMKSDTRRHQQRPPAGGSPYMGFQGNAT